MVLLNPIPAIIANKIILTKITYNLPDDSFLFLYKVDYSDKIVCFLENRTIVGLAIIVWNNDHDLFPREQLVVLKLYCKPGIYLNSNELAIYIIIRQLDKDNYEIESAQSRNVYIFNLNLYTIKDFEVIRGRTYLLKKKQNTELSYEISLYEY
jgi:hypothetical protein